MMYRRKYNSPVGVLLLTSDGENLTGLDFTDEIYEPAEEGDELPVFDEAVRWLDLYFEGKEPDFIPPLKPAGSDFRKTVGEVMLDIPYGQTVTYGDIAKEMAKRLGKEKMSAQAVGGAVGHNPIAIIIPCHRVIGVGGNLTGYGGGMKRKVFLMKLEGMDFEERGFTIPTKGTKI